jgi:hypothetical protein
MAEMSQRNRLSTIGGLLTYQPHAPQHDPIARDVNVQIEHAVRSSLMRATFDSPHQREFVSSLADQSPKAAAACGVARISSSTPRHITIELNTSRTSTGLFAQSLGCPINRKPFDEKLAERVFSQLSNITDLAITFAGSGDPLLHPHFDDIVRIAKRHGVRGINVRTELLVDQTILQRLLDCGADVISVDLNADRAATYQAMMGVDRFKEVLLNIEYVLEHRRKLTNQPGSAAFALPWIVPHIQRCSATHEDIDPFFDRWQHMLGTVVIEELTAPDGSPCDHGLTPALTPQRVIDRDLGRTFTMLCDGSVPVLPRDFTGAKVVGNVGSQTVDELWRSLLARRFKVV